MQARMRMKLGFAHGREAGLPYSGSRPSSRVTDRPRTLVCPIRTASTPENRPAPPAPVTTVWPPKPAVALSARSDPPPDPSSTTDLVSSPTWA